LLVELLQGDFVGESQLAQVQEQLVQLVQKLGTQRRQVQVMGRLLVVVAWRLLQPREHLTYQQPQYHTTIADRTSCQHHQQAGNKRYGDHWSYVDSATGWQ
jgi:hypothetical protein